MKKLLVVLSILVLIIIVIGCATKTTTGTSPATSSPASVKSTTASSSPTLTPKYGGTLVIIYSAAPTVIGWPPQIALGGVTVLQGCMEPPLHATATGELKPWLAESYKVADNLTSITFNFRKGVKFHDGTDFNAQAAKWNLDNQIQAKREPYWKSVDVIDDYTIRVNLTGWNNYVLNTFTDDDPNSWMVSPTAFQKNGIDWVRKNPVGTGPFKFVSYTSDTGLKTVRNPDYWGKDSRGNQLPYLEALEFIFVADPGTQLAVMKSGGADAVGIESGKRAADMAASGLTIFGSINGNSVLYPDTANTDSPFSNQKVREAVEYSIDREAIAKTLGYGYWKAPYQIPSYDSSTYNPNFALGRQFNIDKAKQLMTEAGYTAGFKTKIVSSPAGRNNDALTALQGYLTAIGIQAEIQLPDQPTFSSIQTSPVKNTLILQGLACTANLNSTIAQFLAATSPRFPSWTRTPEFTKLVNMSGSSPMPNIKLMQACMDQLTKECAIIPVHSSGQAWAYRSYVMDIGLGEKSQPVLFTPEKVWLNK